MGLDVSHGCWRGAYSAFNRWRNELAVASGRGLMSIPSAPGIPVKAPRYDWDSLTETEGQKALWGSWDELPDDPLDIIFCHYDCEGIIQAAHCEPLADRLEGLLPDLEGKDGGGHIGDYAEKTRMFIAGLREAGVAGEDVVFE